MVNGAYEINIAVLHIAEKDNIKAYSIKDSSSQREAGLGGAIGRAPDS